MNTPAHHHGKVALEACDLHFGKPYVETSMEEWDQLARALLVSPVLISELLCQHLFFDPDSQEEQGNQHHHDQLNHRKQQSLPTDRSHL